MSESNFSDVFLVALVCITELKLTTKTVPG